jgi:hypothetical protein
VRWTTDTQPALRATHVLSDELVALHLLDGSLRLVDLRTGKVRTKFDGAKVDGHVVRPALDASGRHLYLSVYGRDRKTRLDVIDLATGKKLRSVTYATGHYAHAAAMQAWQGAGTLLPVVVRDPPKREGNRVRSTNLSTVKFLDAGTGKMRDDLKLPVKRPDGKVEKLRSLIVQDGVILLIGYNWLAAYGHDDGSAAKKPATPKPKAKPAKPDVPKRPDKTENAKKS